MLKVSCKLTILVILIQLINNVLRILEIIVITKLKLILRDKAIDKRRLKIFVLTIILSRLLTNRAIASIKVI